MNLFIKNIIHKLKVKFFTKTQNTSVVVPQVNNLQMNENRIFSLQNKIKETFQHQAQIIDKTSTSIESIKEMLCETQKNSADNNILIKDLLEKVIENQERIEEFSIKFNKLDTLNNDLKDVSEVINGISLKIQAIHDIVLQTQMLSFNASIEAARAGEYGKGFTVVADSVRTLANKSSNVANEIDEIVQSGVVKANHICSEFHNIYNATQSDMLKILADFQMIAAQTDNIEIQGKTIVESCNLQNTKVVSMSDVIKTELETLSKFISDMIGIATGKEINDVTGTEIVSKIHEYIIIDVRKPIEFNDELGHIKGANLLTLQDRFEERIQKLPKQYKYLFVCRSGGRSARGARIAQANGFNYIYNLKGGMTAWNKDGLPSIKDPQSQLSLVS